MTNRKQFQAFLVIFVLCGALILGTLRMRMKPCAALYTANTAGHTLIIDAGHGGEDGGALSLSGQRESQINLAIARRLDLILGFLGTQSTMLRQEDISLHSAGAETIRQKKVSDLHNRVDTINAANNAIVISIHQNSYPDSRYGGAQVFYAATEGSEELANLMQETLRANLEVENNRQAKRIQDTIYLMNHINCPAILVECGFLSNAKDERKLLDPNYQVKLAATLANGYLQFLGDST